uniref:Putative capsid protein n=1 Tax=viral metagenome TaxID=1070528 RepID=A0A6M3LFE0_9ZZZZ
MALTLLESSKIALGRDQDLKATIMELYAKSSDLLQYMPFENITGNALTFNQEQILPTVAFRGVNEAYTEGTGQVNKVTESLAIAGGDLDVDKFLVKTGGVDQRATQEAMKIKALSLSLTKEIVKGDITVNAKSFDGLQVRLTGTQRINCGSATTSSVLTLNKLDETIDAVDEPTHLLMNKTFRRRLSAAARNSAVGGYITYDVDSFGRRVTKYNDLPILIADKDNTNAEILPFTEVTPGPGAAGCSVYALSFDDMGVLGLQSGEMDVNDLGEIDDKPVFRTRVEWYLTLAIMRPKSAARLRYILDGAATA